MIGRSLSRSGSGLGIGLSAVVETAEDIHPGQPRSLEQALDHINLLQARLQHAEEERRKCLDASRNLRGTVRVMARVRPPLSADEDEDPCLRIISRTQLEVVDQPRTPLAEPRSQSRLQDGNARRSTTSARSPDALGTRSSDVKVGSALGGMKSKSFFFDQLLGPDVTDDEVFGSFLEDFSAAIDGEPVSILCYGATGSGKTHTTSNLLSRLSAELEQQAQSLQKGGLRLELAAQVVEIYNEQVRDLLTPEPGMREGPMRLQSTASSQSLHGASRRVFDRRDNISSGLDQILKTGKAQRATFGTAVHGRSSRSHMVLALTLTTVDTTTGEIRKTGKLSFVDLAGNERVKKSEVEGDRLKEAQYINKSLSALADVVGAKERRMGHIPYRNSKLTHILQETLDDPCARIVFIATLPPSRSTLLETVNTLQFSMRLNSLALQSLQVAAASHEEIRAEYRIKLEEKNRIIEDRENKVRERDIQLEEKSRELKELKQIIARLTLAQQKVFQANSEPISPADSANSISSPGQRRSAQTPTSPTSPTPPYEQRAGWSPHHTFSQNGISPKRPPGGRPEDPRESSAGRKLVGGRSEDPGASSSREGSRHDKSGPSSREAMGRAGARKEEPASTKASQCASRSETGNAMTLLYSYEQNNVKPLKAKLSEMRLEAGVSEDDWNAGLSIIDTWGDEVDTQYHVFKIQFPLKVYFRPGKADFLGPSSNKGVAKVNQPQGQQGSRDGARTRSNSGGSAQGSTLRNTSPREYSVKVTSPERARELTHGNLPPPIDSPGVPLGGCYQEITSVVRMNTGGSDASADEMNDIRERLLAAVKVASPIKATLRSGSSDSIKDRARGAKPASKENTTPARIGLPGHHNTTTRGTPGAVNRPQVASPRQQEVSTPTKGWTPPVSPHPHSIPSSAAHLAAGTPPGGTGPRSSSLPTQPGRIPPGGTPPQVPPPVQQRTGSHSPRIVQPGTAGPVAMQPGYGSYANMPNMRSASGAPIRMANVPHAGPRIASRSPPHHGQF